MTGYPANQVFSPPELPPYLKSVNLLQPVVGAPNDEELIGILSVIRAAQKAAEIPGMGNCLLISRLSEHLFDVQMARYRSKHLVNTFPENTTYNPPTLPAHVFLQLEPVTGVPSEEEAIKVQDAIRIYSQFSSDGRVTQASLFANTPANFASLLYPARHTQRARQSHVNPPPEIPDANLTRSVETATNPIEEPTAGNTNNAGTGAGVTELVQSARDGIVCDAIERSNRLAVQANGLSEQANLLIERSNQIAERSNQLIEQASRPMEQSNKLSEHFSQIFERLNHHLEQSNILAKESKPVEKLGEVLGNINRVLVRIQHAIIRNHKGNTVKALDCLVNEKGETPTISDVTWNWTFADFLKDSESLLPVVIDGVSQDASISDGHLGRFLRFYGIGDSLFKDASSTELLPEHEFLARYRLTDYLNSCLG